MVWDGVDRVGSGRSCVSISNGSIINFIQPSGTCSRNPLIPHRIAFWNTSAYKA